MAAESIPVLLIGHLDVVEARREDWTTIRFSLWRKKATTMAAALRT